MRVLLFLLICLSTVLVASGQTEIKTSESALETCTLKTLSKEWEPSVGEINCKYLDYVKIPVKLNGILDRLSLKDKSILETEILPLLQKGFRIEIASNYVSSQSSRENKNSSIRRAILLAQYLSDKGIDERLFLINGFGDVNNTTGFSYRAIDFIKD